MIIHAQRPRCYLLVPFAIFAIFIFSTICGSASAAPPRSDSKRVAPPTHDAKLSAPEARSPAAGFYPDNLTLFAPILKLASPGPDRAARALAIMDRQLTFQRKLSFHPQLSPALQHVVDLLPPRQSTMIRAAAIYSNTDIPWTVMPDGIHQIAVAGQPRAADYLYSLTKQYTSPEEAERFSGLFALKPAPGSSPNNVSNVIGSLSGEVMTDTYGIGAIVDAIAEALRESYGELKPPWDTAPGSFNHFDKAALERFHRQMPHLAAKFDEYLKFNNVLDEFESPAGPIVLLNVDAEVHLDALKHFPHLYDFYRKLAPAVTANSAVYDSRGNYWSRSSFDRGHMRASVMGRNGLLTPFDSAFKPAGESVALDQLEHGGYRTLATGHIVSMAMNFGLANVGFTTDYRRNAEQVTIDTRMNAVPELIAPPGIHKAMDFIAGRFLRVMAQGNGGMRTRLSSARLANGMYHFSGGGAAELDYSPTLEFLARIGDAIATQHNDVVRTEERALGEELFDAFVADYNDARPAILALDKDQGNAK
ncbi:MAG: hypothetical protein Q7S58_17575 [Candidatus Binatus sp.]|uniref:hypothetical protein n=1 Tax=Candidatus Binatus sp. TaxID=2811406 RepID=UPI00271E6FC2|nr:hypothetical protein [Candidatus Binatus sp.]MDO8434213.1 hypothetical protein [Candidatus Binatus sp.]